LDFLRLRITLAYLNFLCHMGRHVTPGSQPFRLFFPHINRFLSTNINSTKS
jgi:hypothetical protein